MAAGGLKGALLQKALTAKIEHFKQTGEVTHRVYDALVFRKVRGFVLREEARMDDSSVLGPCVVGRQRQDHHHRKCTDLAGCHLDTQGLFRLVSGLGELASACADLRRFDSDVIEGVS